MIFLLWALFIYKFNQFIIDALDACSIKQSGDADSPRKNKKNAKPVFLGVPVQAKTQNGIENLEFDICDCSEWIDFKATLERQSASRMWKASLPVFLRRSADLGGLQASAEVRAHPLWCNAGRGSHRGQGLRRLKIWGSTKFALGPIRRKW